VITSRWEGLPFLPLEAMWRDVPVVSVNMGAISEIIEDQVSGILINSRSPDEIAKAVRNLDHNSQLRRQIIKNARSKVKHQFSVEHMLGRIKSVYERFSDNS